METEGLQSRLRFEKEDGSQPLNQPADRARLRDNPPEQEEDNHRGEQEPQHDPRIEDPSPNVAIPHEWNTLAEEHRGDTDNWFDEIDSETGDFTQKDMTMEPRRIRSDGIGNRWMIPDIRKRGQPYFQEQTFQQDRQLTPDEAQMICLQQYTPETIAKLLDKNQFTIQQEPLNFLTMGITESEILAKLRKKISPMATRWV